MDNELHVVLGATGGIGSAVVAAATEAGLAVRGVSRSGGVRKGPGGDARAADVSTPEGARHAVEGASVVYHCAQPPYAQWSQHFPPMTATIADACQEVGARLVFADNLYMYEPVAGPIREDSPQHPTSRKGRVRREMADALLARHARGDLSVAIGRASDYFGPHGADSTPGALLFGPLGKGRKPRWLGTLDAPHTLHYLPDVGRSLVALGTRPESGGRAWILPAAHPLTGAQWIERAAAAAGRAGLRPGLVTPTMNRVVGVLVPMVRELNEIMYQFTAPFVADDAAFRTAFPGAGAVTDVDEALRTTVAWFAGDGSI
ncbi:MAG: NAD-dependent epimerase/dehydratase family protein [Actinomycetota bacterium]|nr:NAD-dependent epimerase/dehydratase family protein [Actinomycetota bacterium]MDH4354160.1 NAD-dependent epimerase/dehydratase family protein [Actinomycetota bacterium]